MISFRDGGASRERSGDEESSSHGLRETTEPHFLWVLALDESNKRNAKFLRRVWDFEIDRAGIVAQGGPLSDWQREILDEETAGEIVESMRDQEDACEKFGTIRVQPYRSDSSAIIGDDDESYVVSFDRFLGNRSACEEELVRWFREISKNWERADGGRRGSYRKRLFDLALFRLMQPKGAMWHDVRDTLGRYWMDQAKLLKNRRAVDERCAKIGAELVRYRDCPSVIWGALD